ncbi:hypothetical protein VP01_3681g1 [Puccinia sorghi]|uniref:Uncharacterized protein n=1 Tax=Puccinia sorghi TaxID=27349 RepID=A0A0L6UUB0_9BASI|nr:hypothetical protein VP01_3681g1 [Puccinia sorghi]
MLIIFSLKITATELNQFMIYVWQSRSQFQSQPFLTILKWWIYLEKIRQVFMVIDAEKISAAEFSWWQYPGAFIFLLMYPGTFIFLLMLANAPVSMEIESENFSLHVAAFCLRIPEASDTSVWLLILKFPSTGITPSTNSYSYSSNPNSSKQFSTAKKPFSTASIRHAACSSQAAILTPPVFICRCFGTVTVYSAQWCIKHWLNHSCRKFGVTTDSSVQKKKKGNSLLISTHCQIVMILYLGLAKGFPSWGIIFSLCTFVPSPVSNLSSHPLKITLLLLTAANPSPPLPPSPCCSNAAGHLPVACILCSPSTACCQLADPICPQPAPTPCPPSTAFFRLANCCRRLRSVIQPTQRTRGRFGWTKRTRRGFEKGNQQGNVYWQG